MKAFLTIFLFLYCHAIHGQQRFVNINDQTYRIKESGKGELTVVFESGMSDSLEVWGSIPDSVALFARVFLYDRAGIGKSGVAKTERTIPNMVSELRSILKDQNIAPPYILVGHSLGGLITRYFSGNYPGEVKGLLLLDPAPESYWNSMSKKDLKEYITGGNEWYATKFRPEYRKEWYRFIPNLEYMKGLMIDSNLQVILVSASAWNWYKYHEDILRDLKNARHFELEGQHHIFKDHPMEIIKYIKELTISL
ncbi:MAG TPA: alpha/beta hydrolase [Bacteroidales bacterium]|jgi:pimeloyl-ACP methyl ester carboxylesterase|nr:alpha/beta hydrolase [Bacteroidales bacterium]